MAAVLQPRTPLFDAAVLTATSSTYDTAYLKRKSFHVVTTAFSGTLDIQLSFDGGTTWINAYYVTRGTPGKPVAAQLSYTADSSSYTYVSDDHAPLMRVDMTRSAGSVTVRLFANESDGSGENGGLIDQAVFAEDAAHTSADKGVFVLAVQKATPADVSTEGDYTAFEVSGGRLWTSALVTAAATSIGKAEDVASAGADVGVPAMAVQKATPANTAGTDGDYEFLQMSAGLLWTSLGSLIAGEDLTINRIAVMDKYTYGLAAAAATTTIATGAGVLQRIVLPLLVASATLKIWDNTAASGAVLLDTVTLPAVLLEQGPKSVELGVSFGTGITVVTTGANFVVDCYFDQ